MILYYTGTGNSRRAAQLLAARLEEQVIDVFPYLKGRKRLELASDRPWIFVAPTYGWQLPHVFRDLIADAALTGSRDAYFVLTCGGGVGNAEAHLKKLCAKTGLRFKGLLPVVMPENYLAMFPVPDERAAAVIVKKADRVVEKAVSAIAAGADLAPVKAGPVGIAMSGIVNTLFTRGVVTAKPFYATTACTGCGLCVSKCPQNNIRLEAGRPVWTDECIHCMACICNCPTEAIEYGKKSKGKPRYVCKPWEETEK